MQTETWDAYDYETWKQEQELERRHAAESLIEELVDRTEVDDA